MKTCPACNSTNVATGFMGKLLRCGDCEWSYLNEYPCDVCGAPSVWSVGIGGKRYHGCKQHREHSPFAGMFDKRELGTP